MSTIHFDASIDDSRRRKALYEGHLFVFSPCPSSLALCEHARNLIAEAFGSLDPVTAQHQMQVEEYAALLAELKPKFIHHPYSKECIQGILHELNCDLEKTYFDVPRMRTSTSDGYLTSGIAYAFHPHRDTWYSAPLSQINWWLPIYETTSDNTMAFHPRYWSEPVKNSSDEYNYYEWNATARVEATKHIKQDSRKQPHAEAELELEPQVRVVVPVGGIMLFSGAQLHSTVPNTSGVTRFSIDFRTVHLDDLKNRIAAPNIDSWCTGTTLRDFLRGSDFSYLPNQIIDMYDDESNTRGILAYRPKAVSVSGA